MTSDLDCVYDLAKPHTYNVEWIKDEKHPFYHKHCLNCGSIIEPAVLTSISLERTFGE